MTEALSKRFFCDCYFWGSVLINLLMQRWALRFWRREVRLLENGSIEELAEKRRVARASVLVLSEFVHGADERLSRPRRRAAVIQKRPGTDWLWRPGYWRQRGQSIGLASVADATGLDHDLQIFHDCPKKEIAVKQVLNRAGRDLTPYGLRFDVFEFAGSFLSLAVVLPSGSVENIDPMHIFGLEYDIETEFDMSISARIKVKAGQVVNEVQRTLTTNNGPQKEAFELREFDFDGETIERVWLDFLITNPGYNSVTFRDINFIRYPSAQV